MQLKDYPVKNIIVAAVLTLTLPFMATAPSDAVDVARADLVARQRLRICSDPADMPFSNDKMEGFENKIGALIGEELKVPVEYTWFPKTSIGFIRTTLFAKKCDLVIGWGQGDDLVLNTNAFYRSIAVMVYKKGAGLDGVEALGDPRLQGKRFGVVQGTPVGNYLAKYGLMSNVKGWPRNFDRHFVNPGAEMIKDVLSGDIDVAVNWGPIAAYWAAKDGNGQLAVVPLVHEKRETRNDVPLAYRITMGVRLGDDAWKRRINEIIARRQGDIDKILLEFNVPLLVDEDTSMEMVKVPRPNGTAVEAAAGQPAPPRAAADQPAPQAAPAPSGETGK